MARSRTSFNNLPPDKLREITSKGGKTQKGKPKSEAHKQKLREAFWRNRAKKLAERKED